MLKSLFALAIHAMMLLSVLMSLAATAATVGVVVWVSVTVLRMMGVL